MELDLGHEVDFSICKRGSLTRKLGFLREDYMLRGGPEGHQEAPMGNTECEQFCGLGMVSWP